METFEEALMSGPFDIIIFEKVLDFFNIDLQRYFQGEIGLAEIFEELAERLNKENL